MSTNQEGNNVHIEKQPIASWIKLGLIIFLWVIIDRIVLIFMSLNISLPKATVLAIQSLFTITSLKSWSWLVWWNGLWIFVVVFAQQNLLRHKTSDITIHEPPRWLKDAIINNTRPSCQNWNDKGQGFLQAVEDGFLAHGEWAEDIKNKSIGETLKSNKTDWDLFMTTSWEIVIKGQDFTVEYRIVQGAYDGQSLFHLSAKGVSAILRRSGLDTKYIYEEPKNPQIKEERKQEVANNFQIAVIEERKNSITIDTMVNTKTSWYGVLYKMIAQQIRINIQNAQRASQGRSRSANEHLQYVLDNMDTICSFIEEKLSLSLADGKGHSVSFGTYGNPCISISCWPCHINNLKWHFERQHGNYQERLLQDYLPNAAMSGHNSFIQLFICCERMEESQVGVTICYIATDRSLFLRPTELYR